MHNCTNVDLTSYAASKAAIDHLVALLASKFAKCEYIAFSPFQNEWMRLIRGVLS